MLIRTPQAFYVVGKPAQILETLHRLQLYHRLVKEFLAYCEHTQSATKRPAAPPARKKAGSI